MKKYISILLAAVLSASLLAGCGGGSGNSGQQPAADAKEEAGAETTADTTDSQNSDDPELQAEWDYPIKEAQIEVYPEKLQELLSKP